ncbi:protein FAM [Ditylenchus destructor]|uniref:Protein FAM n=1 Tax=Ditylenchus destructor TaxID=166010 RepID=A0AAD4QZV1_9BILA|nr:protein FAM [Ditylenchus destructor]
MNGKEGDDENKIRGDQSCNNVNLASLHTEKDSTTTIQVNTRRTKVALRRAEGHTSLADHRATPIPLMDPNSALVPDILERTPRCRAQTASTNFGMMRMSTAKRKYSSFELGSSPVYQQSLNCPLQRQLPTFISSTPDSISRIPSSITAPLNTEFATPTHQPKRASRPNSPSTIIRPIPSRGRIASIRRESDCSIENEAAHEKLVKTSQQVSIGFEDFCLDDQLFEERKRAKSLTEPISIFTNAFLPQSSSPSPTRVVDIQKQCYSPSTQQVVRCNISYSPSPSPTPSSPTRNRIMRSMSPIAARQISKRRFTASANGSGLDSDNEGSLSKRQCVVGASTPRSAASPLVRDPLSSQSGSMVTEMGTATLASDLRSSSPYCSTSSTMPNFSLGKSPLLIDLSLSSQYFNSPGSVDLEDNCLKCLENCCQVITRPFHRALHFSYK